MTNQKEVNKLLDKLNEQIGGLYKFIYLNKTEMVHAEVNARYMENEQYRQLVDNIKKDKQLGSVPLVVPNGKGKYEIISGNHRIMAGKDAGLEDFICLIIDQPIDESQKYAIQLSHNSITGKDDLQTLAIIWSKIQDVGAKMYSGLDDETVKSLENINFTSIKEENLKFHQLNLMFLPNEIKFMNNVIEKVNTKGDTKIAVSLESFDEFFRQMVKIKEIENLENHALAFYKILELANERLEQLESEPKDA